MKIDNKNSIDEIELKTSNQAKSSFDQEEENEIDLLELAMKLWAQRKKILIWCCVGAIVGLVVAFSIPKEYETEVKLVPEAKGGSSKLSGSLGAMASLVGLSGSSSSSADAVNPTLYPDVVSSIPFAVGLFDVPVETIDGEKTSIAKFLEDDTKTPWWSAIMGLPMKAIGAVLGLFRDKNEDEDADKHELDTFQLTQKENGLVMALKKRVLATVDTKTGVISIEVTMQDPMVSALLADTVVARLQDYITEYRTNKARQDLKYAELLNKEAQENYYKKQQAYADYLDRNQRLILNSAKTTSERMENEATLAFNVYNQTAQQVQIAKAKVQENTPAYTILSPASVPLRPASPKKPLILVGFVFLAFVACSAWILFGKPLVEEMKQKKLEETTGN